MSLISPPLTILLSLRLLIHYRLIFPLLLVDEVSITGVTDIT
jgi:hypothetical protein